MAHPRFFALCLIPFLTQCHPTAQAGLRTLEAPQGGTIVYGQVDGADSRQAAMASVLRSVHNQCGERPKVGRPFQVRGNGSVAVFFTVTRRGEVNKEVAGMVIGAEGAPGRFEAALVTHEARQFGATINPMLNQLFQAWHPVGEAAPVRAAAPQAGPPPMRRIVLQDQSASLGLPEGWRLDPQSAGGSARVFGPQGEVAYFNQTRMAMDLTDPTTRSLARGGIQPRTAGSIVCPFNVDPVKAFPERFHQYYRLNGLSLNASNCRFDTVEPLSSSRGQTCVHATGHVDPDGKGMREMNVFLATGSYNTGTYLVVIYITLCPAPLADRERTTLAALLGTYQVNEGVVAREAHAIAAPVIAQIKAVGAAATARYLANDAANDRQHADWNARQDSQARGNAGFHNYLLDQTVIQDNNHNAHGTVWNSTADALVRADPNRFEMVQTPNFWKGIDY
jgi:hypothetical protein